MRAGAVEPAVQTNLEILAARRTSGGAVYFAGVLDDRAAEMTPVHIAQDIPNAIKRVVCAAMFDSRRCAEKGCNRPALSGSAGCIVHTNDAAQHVAALLRRESGEICLRDLDLPGIRIEDAD